MLHPKNNRIDYGSQLVPPDGYELAHAIGTSYSLDLEALMILPVALFYAQQMDGNPQDPSYDMLDAITQAADKITIFYQKSQLKVPKKYHFLMAYWEKGVVAVDMKTHLKSFHPKIWVVRYEHKTKPVKYRILISSRNLTFSRDWDVAFASDGIVTGKEQIENAPLVDFLRFLSEKDKRKTSKAFIKDLSKVKFDIPPQFDSLDFMPIGVPNTQRQIYQNSIRGSSIKWNEMLIISPFLDKTTLTAMAKSTIKKPLLLSRKEELDSIDEETLLSYECWQFSTFFQEAEYFQELEDDGDEPYSQNLHAKLFIGMRGNTPHWFVGSANCSAAAQERNVEFMVELKGKNLSGIKTRDIFKALTDPSKADGITLFTPYIYESRVSVEEQKRFDLTIRKIKFDLTQMDLRGTAQQIEGASAYDLKINIDATALTLPANFQVRVKPVSEQNRNGELLRPASQNIITSFGGYSETALSIYLILEIIFEGATYSSLLLPMEIELPEGRLNKIFTSIINSRDKFLKYLAFLLTGEETSLISNSGMLNSQSTATSSMSPFTSSPVYEKMLIAASRYPEKLKAIEVLIQRLKQESLDLEEQIITPEFESFWNVFQTFLNPYKK